MDAKRRRLWMRSRGVLRALLGRYLGTDPASLRLAAGAYGKPILLDDRLGLGPASKPPASPISFNLSHSSGLALYAFAAGASVGVDVELARRRIDAVAIAARVFGAEEGERMRQLDAPAREREFLRAWVRHEASLKCAGTGLGAAGAVDDGSRPWIAELDIGEAGAAAVAVAGGPLELRCWDWP